MSIQETTPHWLTNYASPKPWQSHTSPTGAQSFTRPLGLVESSFDADGTLHGGRADMTATLTLCANTTLSPQHFRHRIVLSWTLLRLRHVLLSARVSDATMRRSFVVAVPASAADAVRDARGSIVWLEDVGIDEVDAWDLHYHALNVARIVQPAKCLAKLHVLPRVGLADGTCEVRFLVVLAHQVCDGVSAHGWFRDLIAILNTPVSVVEAGISAAVRAEAVQRKLPPPQEALYPAVRGNAARRRWFWAIVRVLRYVGKSMSPTFANPLLRAQRQSTPMPLPPTYAALFDYDGPTKPPMSSGHVSASLSPRASARMLALCKDARVSVGAGCFALAGLAMMDLHSALDPSSHGQLGFGTSFPLNPRAFFTPAPPADSCMLAFSEGFVMPFLPASIPVEKRFVLVAKHANRELRVYQKRLRTDGEVGIFDKHSSARLLATGYLAQMERVEDKLPAERRTGFSPQGDLTPRVGKYGATCGVSSVGSLAGYLRKGEYDVRDLKGKDFVADYRGLRMGVRARENEFLIGSSTDAQGIVGFGVSYDESAISREAAEEWARTIEGLLEAGNVAKL